jgi:hypothetical protein
MQEETKSRQAIEAAPKTGLQAHQGISNQVILVPLLAGRIR